MSSARFLELHAIREELLDAVTEANNEAIEAWHALYDARGTRRESGAQGAVSRADAALDCANDALREWEESPEGIEWAALDAKEGPLQGYR